MAILKWHIVVYIPYIWSDEIKSIFELNSIFLTNIEWHEDIIMFFTVII